ncbi:MAG: hypothetical protein ABI560_01725 [Myxococcales bacterium]
MAKPPRSPLLGYNHNLTHLGRVFHIQTEDSGPITPRLFTHLFYEGTILVSRRLEYDASLPDENVRALMQAQHKTVMKDLVRARLDTVIYPFFAARGEDLVAPVQGALPTAALSGTPGPVVVLPEATLSEPVGRHRRSATRSFETTGPSRGPTPASVVVRAPDGRRSPFVRSGNPAESRISSTDGVVVQRNVVVGGGSAPTRPARIRPPVPYVVTGGDHTERPLRPAPAAASPAVGAYSPESPAAPVTASTLAPLVGAALSGETGAPRVSTGAFELGLADDKSLDEVILEYLSEEGDPV